MAYVLVFIFGAVVGSFLNVVILRYNTGFSPFKGGSKCFSCGKNLRWHELVPIFSFLIQRGRCRGCGSKISWQYPTVELLTGLLFLLFFFNYRSGTSIIFILYCWVVVSLLVVIAVYDFRHQIIPNLFVWLFNALAFISVFGILNLEFVSNFEFRISDLWPRLLAGICFFSFFALLWLVSKGRWMGFGDAKLALGLGWMLGPEKTLLALLFSFWLGAIVGLMLMALKSNKFGLKSKIPFGPFLALGSVMALLIDFNIFNLILLR